MKRTLKRSLFRIYLLSTILGFSGVSCTENESMSWVVLPDSVHPFGTPSWEGDQADWQLGYPDKVFGAEIESVRPSDSTSWVLIDHEGKEGYLPLCFLVLDVPMPQASDWTTGAEIMDKWTPLPVSYCPQDLESLDPHWNFHDSSAVKLLRKEALEALTRMLLDAESRGIDLRVFSAFRSFDRQRQLYLRELSRGYDQRSVAKPGHSEHQLGTTVDLCAAGSSNPFRRDFHKTKEGLWLHEHAMLYGFVPSYMGKQAQKSGYIEEPWHFRYVGSRSTNAGMD